MRRLLVLALLVLAAAPNAQAAEAVPAPTATVQVLGPGGVGVPKATTTATWSENGRGRGGDLMIQARNTTGLTTVIDATWTSKAVRVYRKIPALKLDLGTRHLGSGSARLTYGLRYRVEGKAWSRWYDTETDTTTSVGPRYRITFDHDLRSRLQFQVRMHVVLTDTSQDDEHWALRANN
jgi:opacity protein-like surface antigen